jgi:hypothetical protein
MDEEPTAVVTTGCQTSTTVHGSDRCRIGEATNLRATVVVDETTDDDNAGIN